MSGPRIDRIGFAFNPTSTAALELREQVVNWSAGLGLDHWDAPAADHDRLIRELPGTGLLVVLGGDGTFLRAASAVVEVDVPLLGINVGKVGFLSKVEATDAIPVLERVQAGAFRLEHRMALEGRILRASNPDGAKRHVALNDVVVARGSLARVVRLDVSIDGSHLATYVADGLVVASPTGSTGYSFSAGGPILDPTARNLIVTPIAGYLTTIRSVVVGDSVVVRCTIKDAHEAMVSIDGHSDVPVAVGDVVEVRALEQPIRLVQPDGALPFWDLLRKKVELLPS